MSDTEIRQAFQQAGGKVFSCEEESPGRWVVNDAFLIDLDGFDVWMLNAEGSFFGYPSLQEVVDALFRRLRGDIAAISQHMIDGERRPPKAAEATAYPYWMIIDPRQMMKPAVGDVASMVTGPFFSRQEANDWLDRCRHRFSDRARVYCASGLCSDGWRSICSDEQLD